MEEQEVQLNYLRVTSDDKSFMEHKICFKQCINNNGSSTLDANENQCVKNCLFKFNAVERLMLEKMRQIMQTYVMSDPNLKAAVSQHANH